MPSRPGLRSQREAAGLSLRALAVRSGFSASYLSRVETGRRPVTAAVARLYASLGPAKAGPSARRAPSRVLPQPESATGFAVAWFGSEVRRLRIAAGKSLGGLGTEVYLSRSQLERSSRATPAAVTSSHCPWTRPSARTASSPGCSWRNARASARSRRTPTFSPAATRRRPARAAWTGTTAPRRPPFACRRCGSAATRRDRTRSCTISVMTSRACIAWPGVPTRTPRTRYGRCSSATPNCSAGPRKRSATTLFPCAGPPPWPTGR